MLCYLNRLVAWPIPAREFDEIAARLFQETSIHSSGSEAFLAVARSAGDYVCSPSQQKIAENWKFRL